MATCASSYFSGSTIMPSQSQHAGTAPDTAAVGAPSPAKSRNPRFAGCIPTTVRHLARSYEAAAAAAAAAGGGDPVITIDGVEVTNVRIVGRAVNVVKTVSSVSFTLDDGTGTVALIRWLTDHTDALEVAFVQDVTLTFWPLKCVNGAYLKIQVALTGFHVKQQGFARSIRSVTNYNEVVLHFIECMHVHLENVQPKMQALPCHAVKANASVHEMQGQPPHAVQTNAPAYVPFSSGVRDHQVHLAQVNQGQFPMVIKSNASTHVPFSGGVREQHNHLAQVNQGQFPMSVQPNASTHVPFSGGMREQHSHFTPQVDQFSAYPGAGGQQHDLKGIQQQQPQQQQHDLKGMVIEMLRQPDKLALENGVHANELAWRLGVPRAQIMETAQRLKELGHLYSTIDEFHLKSIRNG